MIKIEDWKKIGVMVDLEEITVEQLKLEKKIEQEIKEQEASKQSDLAALTYECNSSLIKLCELNLWYPSFPKSLNLDSNLIDSYNHTITDVDEAFEFTKTSKRAHRLKRVAQGSLIYGLTSLVSLVVSHPYTSESSLLDLFFVGSFGGGLFTSQFTFFAWADNDIHQREKFKKKIEKMPDFLSTLVDQVHAVSESTDYFSVEVKKREGCSYSREDATFLLETLPAVYSGLEQNKSFCMQFEKWYQKLEEIKNFL